MPSVPGATAVAGGFLLSSLRIGESLARSGSVGVCGWEQPLLGRRALVNMAFARG